MAEAWDEHLMLCKYHLSVAKRMYENFSNYETKRFLSGCLNEMALSASSLVNACLVFFHEAEGARVPIGVKARLDIFKKRGGKKFGGEFVSGVMKIFEIRRAQKNSPIELLRQDKILLLDKGEYRALTFERIGELILGLEEDIRIFSKEL